MPHDIQCWKCGGSLSALSLPFGRQERCKACAADLHVCKLCRHYAPRLTGECEWPGIEEVRDKEHANFCDHYQPVAGAWKGGTSATADAARAALEKLFGK